MHVGMLRMEGVGIFMTGVILPILLCYVSMAQADNCLRGFSEKIPPREDWASFSTTILDCEENNDRRYLFPSLRFTCNGTLEALTFPFELRGSASRHWDNIINIDISVWRPTMRIGYARIRQITARMIISGTNRIVTLDKTEVLQFNRTLAATTKIQANDVIALTYNERDSVNGVEVTRHCPFLFWEEPSSVILQDTRDESFLPLGSNFFLPIIMAKFIPDSLQASPDTSTEASPDVEQTPSSDPETETPLSDPETETPSSDPETETPLSDSDTEILSLDSPLVAAGITAVGAQLEVLFAILVTAVIACGCRRRAKRKKQCRFVKANAVPITWIGTKPPMANLPDSSGHGVHEYAFVSTRSQTEYPNRMNKGNGQNEEEDAPIYEYLDTGNSPKTETATHYYI